MQLSRSDLVPAASGELKVGEDDGKTTLELKVKHLAPANRIAEGATHYVVWVQPLESEINKPVNVGTLKIDDDLEGTLETTTKFAKFELFVTAENSASAGRPAGERILWSTVR